MPEVKTVTLFCSCGWSGENAPLKRVYPLPSHRDDKEPACPKCGKFITEFKEVTK